MASGSALIAPLLGNYGIRQSRIATNGVELDVLESGPADGQLVVLSHGFPELAWSWRHQLKALGEAGYHAVAPDQRGYGWSARPTEVEQYSTEHLAADLLGLVDHFDGPGSQAVFVGHDWGALLVWDLAREHPRRAKAVINLSVPFVDWPAPPTQVFKMLHGDNFFYILYFQPVGVAEAELDPQPERVMRGILWAASGEGFPDVMPAPRPMAGSGFTDGMGELGQIKRPDWVSEEDVAVYAESFANSGFFGPVSWYRNLDRNQARVASSPVSAMTMPTWFIGGTKDLVIARDVSAVEARNAVVPGFRGQTIIEGAGHWTQQERPAETNTAILKALESL